LKSGKTSWIYLGVALVAIAAVLLVVAQSGLDEKKATLISDLDDATTALRQLDMESLKAEQRDAQALLEEARDALESEQDKYRSLTESLAASETLFEIAEECGVSIFSDGVRLDEFHSTGTGGNALEGIPCLALPVIVQVVGDVDDILDFVKRVTMEYPFATLVSVNINIPAVEEDIDAEGESEGEGEGEGAEGGEEPEEPVVETEPPKATVSLIIYTYQGETDGSQ